MDMTKITTDFNATESAATVRTRLTAMATFYGSAAAYSDWGDARADLNGYTPVAQAIADLELASAFIDKLNNFTNVPSVHWDDSADTYKKKASGTNVTTVHSAMKRCVLNADGSVNYYLDPTDSTQKEAGGAADLTGADGNVMVEIPKFWFHHELSGGKNQWRISPTAIAGYTLHPAFVKAGVEVDHRYIGAYDACLKFSRSITAVADAGGGNITLTTSAQHPLYAGDSVTISGTTSYDGTYTVVTRASNTTFTVTAAFVATETGTAAGYVSGQEPRQHGRQRADRRGQPRLGVGTVSACRPDARTEQDDCGEQRHRLASTGFRALVGHPDAVSRGIRHVRFAERVGRREYRDSRPIRFPRRRKPTARTVSRANPTRSAMPPPTRLRARPAHRAIRRSCPIAALRTCSATAIHGATESTSMRAAQAVFMSRTTTRTSRMARRPASR
jgi:hypothetical protein